MVQALIAFTVICVDEKFVSFKFHKCIPIKHRRTQNTHGLKKHSLFNMYSGERLFTSPLVICSVTHCVEVFPGVSPISPPDPSAWLGDFLASLLSVRGNIDHGTHGHEALDGYNAASQE